MMPSVVPFPEKKHGCPGCGTPTVGAVYCIDCRLLGEELSRREKERSAPPPTPVPMSRHEIAMIRASWLVMLGAFVLVWTLAFIAMIHLDRLLRGL